ncbi:MAG: tetratricopeptide repeat protein [Bacteroidales bacterium]|nr:tetratricopeptide repeat protein [Bacteroidales bacterium]
MKKRHIYLFRALWLLLLLAPLPLRSQTAPLQQALLAGNYEKAFYESSRLLAADSSDATVWFLRGRALLALLRYDEAEKAFLQAGRHAPDSMPLLMALGQTASLLGHDADAIRWYEKVLQESPDNTAARIGLARACYRRHLYQQAIRNYKVLVEKHSSNYAYNKELGQAYLAVDSIKQAQWFFHNAVNHNNGDLSLATQLARLYIKTKDYHLAADIALLGLRSDSTYTPLLETLGFARYREKDYLKAAPVFERCLRLGDSSVFVLKHIGYIYLAHDRYDDAVRMLSAAWQHNNTLPEIAYYMGLAYENSERYDTAAYWLEKALVLYHPPAQLMAAIYRELANNYYLSEKWFKAFNNYTEALKLDPKNPDVLFRMAEICDYYTNEKKKAIYYYRRVMALSEINPATWDAEKTTTIPLAVAAYHRIQAIKEEMHFAGERKE